MERVWGWANDSSRTVDVHVRWLREKVEADPSKARRIALRTMRVCGLDDLFEVTVCGDEVSRGKPDPEPVAKALDALSLGHAPDQVVFVGDSPHDMRAGKLAGVQTAAVGWGPLDRRVLQAESPDFFLERMEDLLRIAP